MKKKDDDENEGVNNGKGDERIGERDTGVEPASQAWEARVLPMYYTRVCLDYSTRRGVWQMN